ncbi:type III secretion system invasion protein IagB [Scandinavium tedordense]|uniref:type III secretion system invasion protein IagB n=1 Tax=Scandinavium tedordense TaxID=2926521 RepID=UPI0021660CAC|nr:type III secretion system invasion protein IagB [Scandinavium tedordense]
MKLVEWVIVALVLMSSCAHADCWSKAGKNHHVDPWLLLAIAQVESGMNPEAVSKNNDGTYDIGLMQINSIHLPVLAKRGITRHRLVNEPCTSIMVGASILADMIKVYGNNWKAVGAYNAGLKKNRFGLRMKYARKVWNKYQRIKPKMPR